MLLSSGTTKNTFFQCRQVYPQSCFETVAQNTADLEAEKDYDKPKFIAFLKQFAAKR